jgi:hypothetical protein
LLLYAIVSLFAFCLITIYLFVTNLWQNYCRLLVDATANKDFLFAREGIAFQIANRDAYVGNPTEESSVFSMNQRVPQRVTASPRAVFGTRGPLRSPRQWREGLPPTRRRPRMKQINLQALPLHDDRGAYLSAIVQVDDVIVGHANAA